MMILKEHNISVRLPQERAIDTGIVFVQNDKDVYKLNVRVFDGDTEINYSQVSSATITFSKADGTVVQGEIQKTSNMLAYVLGTNEIAVPGKLIASIQLLGANERLTTARFVFTVEKDLITEDAVKSTSEFSILQQLKQELEDIDVVKLTNQFNAHKADTVTDADGVHGLKIESGKWTPYIYGTTTAGTHTYSTQYGKYTKIGNVVHIQGVIFMTSKDATMAGEARIGGLPFRESENYGKSLSLGSYANIVTGGKQLTIVTAGENSYTIRMYLCGDNTSAPVLMASAITNTTSVRFAGTYITTG